VAMAAARRGGLDQTVQELKKLQQRLAHAQRSHAGVLRALQILETHPDDADANMAVGKHYGLMKGQWDRGLPFLSKCNDSTLAAAGRAELPGPGTAEQMITVGDLWWRYGECAGVDRRAAQLRAGYWYVRVLQTA